MSKESIQREIDGKMYIIEDCKRTIECLKHEIEGQRQRIKDNPKNASTKASATSVIETRKKDIEFYKGRIARTREEISRLREQKKNA